MYGMLNYGSLMCKMKQQGVRYTQASRAAGVLGVAITWQIP